MSSFARRDRAQRATAVVGVDAGKFHHVLVVRPRGRPDSKPFRFAANRCGFEQAVVYIREQIGVGTADDEILVGIEFAGSYGFTLAHYLHALGAGFGVVTVLPAHTKRWKEVAHRQPLKTDAKDAIGITDLAAQGHFVAFPFLAPVYAELRYLLSARERVSTLRRGAITRIRTTLDVVFPEFGILRLSRNANGADVAARVSRRLRAASGARTSGRHPPQAAEPQPHRARVLRSTPRSRGAHRGTASRARSHAR
jgi:transposase